MALIPPLHLEQQVSLKIAPGLQSTTVYSASTLLASSASTWLTLMNPFPFHPIHLSHEPSVGLSIARIHLKCPPLSPDWQTTMADNEWSQGMPCHGASTQGRAWGLQSSLGPLRLISEGGAVGKEFALSRKPQSSWRTSASQLHHCSPAVLTAGQLLRSEKPCLAAC